MHLWTQNIFGDKFSILSLMLFFCNWKKYYVKLCFEFVETWVIYVLGETCRLAKNSGCGDVWDSYLNLCAVQLHIDTNMTTYDFLFTNVHSEINENCPFRRFVGKYWEGGLLGYIFNATNCGIQEKNRK